MDVGSFVQAVYCELFDHYQPGILVCVSVIMGRMLRMSQMQSIAVNWIEIKKKRIFAEYGCKNMHMTLI